MSDYNETYVFLFSKTVQQLTPHIIYALSTDSFCDGKISRELWPPPSPDRNTSLGAQPASYAMSTGVPSRRVEAAGA